MTYEEIYKQFKDKCNIDEDIDDYRPAYGMYIDGLEDCEWIPNAIIVWLKDGTKIIYIAKE